MSTKEQEKVIETLRKKAARVDYAAAPDTSKKTAKIDTAKVWALAERVGRTIRDDSLSAPHPSGA